jgi:hypothetical protein
MLDSVPFLDLQINTQRHSEPRRDEDAHYLQDLVLARQVLFRAEQVLTSGELENYQKTGVSM